MKILISFIIPVYNCELYLERCINSIINGQWEENKIQIILINDGSTDNSLEICNNLFSKFPTNIEVYTQLNSGASTARNVGLSHAKGEFIWFVDADDFINTKEIPQLTKYLSNAELNVFCFNYIKETLYGNYEINNFNSKTIVSAEKYLMQSRSLYLWDKIYRRTAIEGIKFLENTKNIEDFLFNIEVLIKEDSVYQIDEYNYVYNNTNLISTSRNRASRNLIKLSEDTIKIHNQLIILMESGSKEIAEIILKLIAFSAGGYIYSIMRYYNYRYLNRALKFYTNKKVYPFVYTGHIKMDLFLRIINCKFCVKTIKNIMRLIQLRYNKKRSVQPIVKIWMVING